MISFCTITSSLNVLMVLGEYKSLLIVYEGIWLHFVEIYFVCGKRMHKALMCIGFYLLYTLIK